MKVFRAISDILSYLEELSSSDKSIGLVPTMGALHSGHLSLVSAARKQNEIVAVSIFVNPIQFNDPSDLKKYPRTLERDISLLEGILGEDDFIFIPEEEEMYPAGIENQVYDFGEIAEVMEGISREGHFNGVGVVVNRLFRIVEPNNAYFGEKDFQQLAIIRKMVEIEKLVVRIVACPIIREKGGLAMSSRNELLSNSEREKASILFDNLVLASSYCKIHSIRKTKSLIINNIEAVEGFSVEYVEFADEKTLQPISSWNEGNQIRCFLAVRVGKVRLIDNMKVDSPVK